MDVVFVNSNSTANDYQDLALTYSAIEPPTWVPSTLFKELGVR